MMGRDKIMGGVVIGQFTYPEGHLIGVLEAVKEPPSEHGLWSRLDDVVSGARPGRIVGRLVEAVEAPDGFTELELLISPPTSPPSDLRPQLNRG